MAAPGRETIFITAPLKKRITAALIDAVFNVGLFLALLSLVGPLCSFLIVFSLEVVLLYLFRTSIGKRFAGLSVRWKAKGAPVLRAIYKYLVFFFALFSIVFLIIGLAFPLFDELGRGWHDRLAGTVVIEE